ncbi:hypothetical protein [Streptomyces sp. NPDC005408]|uniref:hypothetical protein n=1 Tax=Streptomyces sp. NPDC005408 TaxID=3155341 RepID=UPI0033A7F7EE
MDIVTRVRSQWDRLTAAATAVGGAVVLVSGWRGVSGTAYVAEQVPYVISAGIGGLFLLGVSSALWLSADLRDEWRKLDRIERAIRASGELGAVEVGAAPVGRDRTVDHDRTVLLPSAEEVS